MPTTTSNATQTIYTQHPIHSLPPTQSIELPCGDIPPGGSEWICECVEAVCISNDTWQLKKKECIPPEQPKCSNGLAPVPVQDADGCCWHWECDCYCTGWGDPHYMTFDGLYYSFQGNCTYVLVEEIIKKHGDFGIYIDNYYCNPHETVSCPRTLIIKYATQEVHIRTVREIPMTVQVLVNGVLVALPFNKHGMNIYVSGLNHVVEIPGLRTNVTYNGMAFTIKMPSHIFSNNTQGQCGTCTNSTADDCRLRNGLLAETCEIMADDWIVQDPNKPSCPHAPPVVRPTTTVPCTPSPLCELIKESVFQKCHKAVSPDSYYAACKFDSCMVPGQNMECASLQNYAATCADQGICIDWRGLTGGACPIHCAAGKVYKACAPSPEQTCKSGLIELNQTQHIEGCFCPEGTTLYEAGLDVCVKTCGCVGTDNIPRKFGEKFQLDCEDCICLEGGRGIICEPHTCPAAPDKTPCEGEGFHEVTQVNPDDKCCSHTVCVCNSSACTTQPPKCSAGFEVVADTAPGSCCPVYQCSPKGVCVHNGNEYKPGSPILAGKCKECVCTQQQNSSTQLNIIHCDQVPCNVHCDPGYTLMPQPGECCGKCIQTSCVIETVDNNFIILNAGERQSDPKNNCTIYSCQRINMQLISSTSSISCSPFNEEKCQPGTITLLPGGCCKTCIPSAPENPPLCYAAKTMDHISYGGCRSEVPVPVAQCEGRCGTASIYSAETNSMQHKCSCCREAKATQKQVTLICPDGTTKTHSYLFVESCECLDSMCEVPWSSERTGKLTTQAERRAVKRRRRAIK